MDEYINIKQRDAIRAKKDRVARQIETIIKEFEEETGTEVNMLTLVQYSNRLSNGAKVISNRVEISITI